MNFILHVILIINITAVCSNVSTQFAKSFWKWQHSWILRSLLMGTWIGLLNVLKSSFPQSYLFGWTGNLVLNTYTDLHFFFLQVTRMKNVTLLNIFPVPQFPYPPPWSSCLHLKTSQKRILQKMLFVDMWFCFSQHSRPQNITDLHI